MLLFQFLFPYLFKCSASASPKIPMKLISESVYSSLSLLLNYITTGPGVDKSTCQKFTVRPKTSYQALINVLRQAFSLRVTPERN